MRTKKWIALLFLSIGIAFVIALASKEDGGAEELTSELMREGAQGVSADQSQASQVISPNVRSDSS